LYKKTITKLKHFSAKFKWSVAIVGFRYAYCSFANFFNELVDVASLRLRLLFLWCHTLLQLQCRCIYLTVCQLICSSATKWGTHAIDLWTRMFAT